ncbi:MAG: lipopolysaccharide biosynthesis protein [Herbinix sp.]|jgi:lipopolysaccharide biosynthesis protein|nr:lipopolysaccharide biosynthesis protein [Herbinix sp.]
MKLISFYLPQYHAIPENDAWWGKGFTEWVNVKKSKPLFRGHNQPRVPLNDDYYNLLDDKVMERQMKLAKKYGVGGFCFYHYWFGGKKLLEKPVERLLQNKNADLPFCLAWANEPWTKTWHGPGGEMEVLIRQQYGDQEEWTNHFNYLLSFFQDDRYLKENNKPIFLIYRSSSMPKCREMLTLWNELAIQNGFDGMFFVDMLTVFNYRPNKGLFSATVDFEPSKWRRGENVQNKMLREWKIKTFKKFDNLYFLNRFFCYILDYNKLNKEMLDQPHKKNEFRGVFVDYDDTARRGKNSTIVKDSNPKSFEYYLTKNIHKSKEEGNEYLFINAWNEWGEGNYLEPDKKYGYAYLHAVRRALKNNQ